MRWFIKTLALSALLIETQAFSQHSVIQGQRDINSNVFVSQAIEGEYGTYNKILSGQSADTGESRIWRGYSFRNGLGLELMKFTQFSVSHSFINMRSKANSLENMVGSRISAEAKLAFSSPIGNMEAGGGFLASRLDYTMKLDNADFLGSGYYYVLGLNYFLSQRVSFFGHGKMIRENMVRNGGNAEIENFKTNTNSLGLGFSIWL